MPYIESSYAPPKWFWGRHIQTIYPILFNRKYNLKYRPERIHTPDDDFLDLDWHEHGSDTLVILSHGLSGSSRAFNVQTIIAELISHKLDVLAWTYRGCGEEVNKQAKMFHMGFTEDISTVVDHAIKSGKYREIHLAGLSAGGQITLSYLAEKGKKLHPSIKRAAVISTPLNLEQFHQISGSFYSRKLLKWLMPILRRKYHNFPEIKAAMEGKKIRTMNDLAIHYTVPFHGLKSLEHYYTSKSISEKKLSSISIPTLILNAANDPFLSFRCFPIKFAKSSKLIYFEKARNGGHVGFLKKGHFSKYWSSERISQFLTKPLENLF